MDDARRAAHQGMNALARDAFPDPATARATVAIRARLLAEIGRHAVTVLGPARVDAWRDGNPARRCHEARQPAVTATLAWIDSLAQHDPARPEDLLAPDLGVAAGHWTRSFHLLRAATDLVATHQDTGGALRPGTRGDLALADVGGLLASATRLVNVIGPIEPLAVRCRQAGMTPAEVDLALPLADRLLEDTWALEGALRFPMSAVTGLPLHRAPIRGGDPAVEWRERMDRVHARMHRHAQRGRVSVRTLHDVATLALVTSHVLTTSGLRDPATGPELTGQWRAVLAHLAPLGSVEPRDRVIRHDTERMLNLARTAGDLPGQGRLLRAIDAGAPTMDACSTLADRLLAQATDAWIPAKPHRPYLRDLHPPGTAARRAPPPEASWPRMPPPPPPASPGLGLP
jgi:hypothetical protein